MINKKTKFSMRLLFFTFISSFLTFSDSFASESDQVFLSELIRNSLGLGSSESGNVFSGGNEDGIVDTYGNDLKSVVEGEMQLQRNIEAQKNGGERPPEQHAFEVFNSSASKQKPDLNNDAIFNYADNLLADLKKDPEQIADCEISTQLIASGGSYHVPKIKSCNRLPGIEETFRINHSYSLGVLRFVSGRYPLYNCGEGCLSITVGERGYRTLNSGDYCRHYSEESVLEVLQPSKITNAKIYFARIDDRHRASINGDVVYIGPEGYFPHQGADKYLCEEGRDLHIPLNINVTSNFKSVPESGFLRIKAETAVYGLGNGHTDYLINYDPSAKIYNDVWGDGNLVEKALRIKEQENDGFCKASFRCLDMPILDVNGCLSQNGVYVCEEDFSSNPLSELGISPFCRNVEVSSDCDFNQSQVCWENRDGVEECFENDTADRNTCKKYEDNPDCSFVSSNCVTGMRGDSGFCYLQRDEFDCGFTAHFGELVEKETVTCDGVVQCMGDDCYSPNEDLGHSKFQEAAVYTEIVKMASKDISCAELPSGEYVEGSPAPDTYVPVKICESGYVWNNSLDSCVQDSGCFFDDFNFYFSSSRQTNQLVLDGVVIEENDEIECGFIHKDGQYYDCGKVKQIEPDGKFYEICTFKKSQEEVATACPTSTHTFNKRKGVCEVLPVEVCNGEIVDGQCVNSCVDNGNDSCVDENRKECPEGYPLLNSREGRCQSLDENSILSVEDQQEQLDKSPPSKAGIDSCEMFSSKDIECRTVVGNLRDCCGDIEGLEIDFDSYMDDSMEVDRAVSAAESTKNMESITGSWDEITDPNSSNWSAVSTPLTSEADAFLTNAGNARSEDAVSDFQSDLSDSLRGKLQSGEGGDSSLGSSLWDDDYDFDAFLNDTLGRTFLVSFAKLALNIVYPCKDEEIELNMRRETLSSHKIGSYCRSDVLGVCLETRDVYCVYSSPLSRIIMEQVYMQPEMNLSWGTPEEPNCRGISISDLDKIDFTKINLDEWVAILAHTGNLKSQSDLNVDTLTGEGSYLDVTDEDRQNIIERTTDFLQGVDSDEVRVEAYNERFNLNQSIY